MEGETPQIMIGCPVSVGKAFILPEYLKHIHQLNYPKDKIHVAFLFNYPNKHDKVAVPHTTINQTSNIDDEVRTIRNTLLNFKRKTKKEYRQVTIHEYTGNYEDRLIQGKRAMGRWMDYFASIRNKWIDLRLDNDDYIYSIDSDILVPRDSLRKLLAHDKPIVSLLLANGPINDPHISPQRLDNFLLPYNVVYGGIHPSFIDRVHSSGRMAFNIMNKYDTVDSPHVRNEYDRINYKHLDPAELHIREIYNYNPTIYNSNLKSQLEFGPWTVPQRYGELCEVDMTGAAYLIKREVLDSGVRYGFHKQGEDCYFSAMAQEKGFTLHCDYNIRANHIMDENVYKHYLQSRGLRVLGFPQKRGDIIPKKIESSVDVKLELVKTH